MTDAISARIDRYQLFERIGTGGMARVYRAKDLNLDRVVAIKILHDHLADDPTFKERFEREARFVASLNHPNIVQIYDFNSVERNGFPIYYMVMPFIAGRSLRDVIEDVESRGERLSYDRVMRIMLDVTDALAYAHAAGMAHRDVKPANILIDADGKAVLTDFGIARIVQSNSRLTQDGMSTGTPAYMSPEQVSGQPGDARSDLYSLGGIFFELLTGRAPYDDESGASLMLKHLQAPVPFVSPLLDRPDPKLDAFIQKALAKNPDDRFQSAKEFSRALREAYAGRDPTATHQSPAPATLPTTATGTGTSATATVSESPQRSRLPFVLAGIGALVLIAVILSAITLTRPPAVVTPTATAIPPLPTIAALGSGSLNTLLFTSNFSDTDAYRVNWPQDNVGGFLREMTADGFYHLRSERVSTASTSLFNTDYAYGSVSISMEGTLQAVSNPAGAFGIAFRYQDQDHYNVFAVDGMGRFSIWVRDNGVWHELRDQTEKWTKNDAIKPLGGKNQLRVDILGDKITGIVNGRQVALVQDRTFLSGNVGIYLATDTSGVTNALIDQYQVFPVSPPSMTGG